MTIRIESGAEPIPGYKLIERLGGGGFGEVWKIEAPGGILKAIKFVYGDLQTEDEDGVRRAEQELKALKRVKSVRHPYLLSLERYDIIDSRLLIVMELADRNLWDRFKECRAQGLPGIPRDELLRYMEEAAEVLDLMNIEYQLQHLDIKPQNLFLVHNHLKVADFGLVKDLEGMSATVTGGVTPVYAAPETFDGVVSRFCDQYSLAIVYQELLTGQRPFLGTNVQQLVMQHLTGTPNVTPLPPNDREAVLRGLAKKPEDRFPSCTDMMRALRQAGQTPARVTVPPPPLPPSEADTDAPPIRTQGDVSPRPTASTAPVGPLYPESRPTGRSSVYTSSYRASVPTAPVEIPESAEPAAPLQGFARHSDNAGAAEIVRPRPSWHRDRTRGQSEFVEPPKEEAKPTRQAPPEVRGEGVLFPAVVIGLGGLGGEVVARLGQHLAERCGSLAAVPHLRLIWIDTDPDEVHEATQGQKAPSWDPKDVVLARLNRPGYYLKPVGGRIRVDSWMNPQILYRIPRNPVTTGVRALGRVAFFDNYRLIATKVQQELEACTACEALTTADRNTKLGVRSNRPRVYVVASLGGGTGSGTFLDVAYMARSQLRQLGYTQPHLVGLFLLPAAERDAARTLALGNTYAALTEWHHFHSPDVTFNTRFDEKDPPVKDAEAPFQRAILLQLPEEANARSSGQNKAVALAADLLCRDLVTPLGRTADENRAPPPTRQLLAQTFGLYRFAWPRRTVVQSAAARLCRRLTERWLARETPPLQAAVQAWMVDQWTKLGLAPEPLIEQLQQAVARTLGQAPEDTFTAILAPLTPRSRKPLELTVPVVQEILARLEQVVGRPENDGKRPASPLADALDKGAAALVAAYTKKVAQLAVCLIEQPDYRVAGAEEAIRQIGAIMDQALESHEPLCQDFADRSTQALERIGVLLPQLMTGGARRAAALSPELAELLKAYPKCRYYTLVLRRIITIYQTLRGQLAEQVREVGFCRQRLGELVQGFSDPGAGLGGGGPGKFLLPAGVRNLDGAIERQLEAVTPEQFKELDAGVQAMIQQQFTSLLQVCMSKTDLFRNLQVAMQQHAEMFLSSRTASGDVAEMFFTKYPDRMDALQALADAYQGAAPQLAASSRFDNPELYVLAVPDSPQGDQVRELARRAVPEAAMVETKSTEEIVFYREQSHLPIANLEQVGPIGEEAYRQMLGTENFTPHCRTDIPTWRMIEAE
jgi:serine/threonine protein kinase